MIVQIYEIQTPEEAGALIDIGVDHFGSVVLSPEQMKNPDLLAAVKLIRDANRKSSLIPLFSEESSVLETIDYYRPDIVHFCESLTQESRIIEDIDRFIRLQKTVRKCFPNVAIMRSIPIVQTGSPGTIPSLDIARMFESASDFFLTDTLILHNSVGESDAQPVAGFVGITGKTCDWDVAAALVDQSEIPVILAGGIHPGNAADGIRHVRPAGVDSCTGTNAIGTDGTPRRFCKDLEKVRRLVDAVRRCE